MKKATVCAREVGEKPPRVWRWNETESLQSLRRIIDIALIESAVEKIVGTRRLKPSDQVSLHPYLAPEELVFDFLESRKLEQTNVGSDMDAS